jgi:uncharacterized protein YgiM (DUF1202 family)
MSKLTTFILLLAISALACGQPVSPPAILAEKPILAEPTANKPAAPSLVPDVSKMVVCADALNVRVGPGTSYETTAETLIRGTIVTMKGTPINSEDGGMWQEITAPVSGYINLKHLCGD